MHDLANTYPGVSVDMSGAGDGLDKVDSKIRQIKEIRRSVIADLPFKINRSRIKDLATYVLML